MPLPPPYPPATVLPLYPPFPSSPLSLVPRPVRYQEAYPPQFTIVVSGFLTFVRVVVVSPLSFPIGISAEPLSEHPLSPQER